MTAKLITVEDDAATLMLLKRYLKRSTWNPEILHFEYGEDAIEFFMNENVGDAVLLLDLNLPDTHGVEILKAIRMRRVLDDMPVIVLTTSNLEHEKEACEELGIDYFLEKPFSSQSLIELVGNLNLQAEAA